MRFTHVTISWEVNKSGPTLCCKGLRITYLGKDDPETTCITSNGIQSW